jgi:hypothetical protein
MNGPWTLEKISDGQYDVFDSEQNFVVGLEHASAEVARGVLALPALIEACEKALELQPVHAMKYLLEAVRIAKGL